MTNDHDSNADHDFDSADPPEGLEITELIANQRFKVREIVSWPTRVGVALILLVAIAFLMVPITQGSLVEEFLKEKVGSAPLILTQLVRVLMIVCVLILSFQLMSQLFGRTHVEGTMRTVTSRYTLLGIPVTRSMNKSEFKLVEVRFKRGHRDNESDVEGRFPGTWKVGLLGERGSLRFYKTGSLEEAKWLSRFVAEWYGLKVERKRDDRKFGF